MMMIGSDKYFRQSGAIHLIYHSILETSKRNNIFDF